jgi:ATP-dependent exoDNAse (exonuclease V) beta subunit
VTGEASWEPVFPVPQGTCDEGVLPLDERVADAADEAELDDIYETERRLLYVACTRAREHLLLTGVAPASEYLADFVA